MDGHQFRNEDDAIEKVEKGQLNISSALIEKQKL